MNLKESTRGAVSVFLVIILVPCIVVTSLFVDLSRVELAKGFVSASGDLALNSLLTNYDFDLNDFYGMVASCQSIEEFYDISERYFVRVLKSQGLSEEEFSGTIMDRTGLLTQNDDISDLLQINVISEGEMIKPVPDAHLANPAILRNQIVEFMKYRAPINIATGLLDKLKTVNNETKNKDKDNELVETKKTYYEAENDFLEKAYEIYEKLEAYQQMAPSGQNFEDVKKNLASYEAIYEEIHKALVKDLFNTSGIGAINKAQYEVKESTTYNDKNRASEGTVNNLISSLNTAKTNYDTAKSNLLAAFPTYNSGIYDIQYWAQNYTAISNALKDLNSAANALVGAYNGLGNARNWLSDEASSLKGAADSAYNSSYTNYIAEITAAANENSANPYLKNMGIIKRISNEPNNQNAINAAIHKIQAGGAEKTIPQAITDISNQIAADRSKMEGFRKALEGIKVSELEGLINKCKTAFEEWESDANAYDSGVSDQDRAEIAKIRSEEGSIINVFANIGGTIDELNKRVESIKSSYESAVKALDDTKYKDTPLKDIKTIDSAKAASGIKKEEIKQTTSGLDNYVKTSFNFTTVSITANLDADNYPCLGQINGVYDKDIRNNKKCSEHNNKSPELWKLLYKRFFEVKPEYSKKAKAKYKQYKKDQEKEKKEGGKEDADSYNTVHNIEGLTNNPYNFAQGFNSIVQLIGDVASGKLEPIRDSIFATEYVTNMFSYYTYEKEGKYNLLKAANKLDGINLDNYKTKYASVTEANPAEPEPNKWYSVLPTDTYNKSLTTKMINNTNNFAYMAELEYILYGKGSSKENIRQAMTDIYGIRLLLNIPSAFMFFWDPKGGETASAIDGVAKAIEAATHVVPAPLVKTVIILMLAAIESAHDLAMLKAGLPVKFIKLKDNGKPDKEWVTSFESVGDDAMDGGPAPKESSESNNDNAFRMTYSNYLYVFLLLAFNNKNINAQMYERTGKVIEANMNYIITKDESGKGDYSLSKSIIYFEIEAEVRVKPLMLALPIANKYEDNPKNNTDWCTFTYKAIRGYY